MGSVPSLPATIVPRQQIPQQQSKKSSSWLPSFWPFSPSVPAKETSLKNCDLAPQPSDAKTTSAAIRLLLPANISIPPNAGLDGYLHDLNKNIDQFQVPLEVTTSTDWRATTNQQLEETIHKESLSQTLEMIHPKLDPNLSAQIIREVCSTNRSLCSVYLEKKRSEIGFLGSLFAQLTYFIYYQCGIIPTIVDASARAILEKLRSELVHKDGGKNLSTLISTVLKRMDSVLADYLKALTEYGNGIGTGSKDDYVKEKLQKDLDAICKEFGEVVVNEFLPSHISFFRSWKENPHLSIRLMAKIFTHYPEKWLTALAHEQLRQKIPGTIKSLIENQTTKEDEERNISFSIAITKGIIEQLEKFRKLLDKRDIPVSASPAQIAGTEKLPIVISQLLEILRLESFQRSEQPGDPRKELKRLLDKNGSSSFSDITTELQNSLIDGCRTFFSYLSNPSNSEEIFSKLLYFSSIHYTSTASSSTEEWTKLNEQYLLLQQDMRRKAGEIFRTITRQSINMRAYGLSDEDQERMAQAFCALEREQWSATADLLQNRISSMQKKLREIPVGPNLIPLPSQDKNIQKDLEILVEEISSFNSHILSSLEELAESEIPDSIQKGIKKSLEPLVLLLDILLYQANAAKDQQKTLAAAAISAQAFRKLEETLSQRASLKLEEIPKLWTLYEAALEQLQTLGSVAKEDTAHAKEDLEQIRERHNELQTESFIVRNLFSLGQDNGLLSQFATAVDANIREPSLIFSTRKFRAQIVILCQPLPEKEKEEILSLVDAMRNAKSIPQLRQQWDEAKIKMPMLYNLHCSQQKKKAAALKEAFETTEAWTKERLQISEDGAKISKQTLSNITDSMQRDVFPLLSGEILEIQPNRIEGYLDQMSRLAMKHRSVATGAVGAMVGGIAAAYLPPWVALPIAGAVDGAVSYMMSDLNEQPSRANTDAPDKAAATADQVLASLAKRIALGATLGTGIGAAVGYGTTFVDSYAEYLLAPLILGHAGKNLPQAVTTGIADRILYPQVQDIFDNLYKFILQPHVWNRLVIEGVDAINVANRKS